MDKPPPPYTAEGIVPGASWNDVLHAQITQYPFAGIADPAQGVEILSCEVD
jgi:hypothetical protein